ncbi:MAG: hypothetical protein CEN90_85 [Parcubacteria group bacterium Licking1014_17]|nr:MAG: hypothetical protein CEN90_85 [Parcubacteria group bacterium Licking1014_17]
MMKAGIICLVLFVFAVFWAPSAFGVTNVQQEIDIRNKQIEEIQKQIDQYQKEIDANSSMARTLSSEIGKLNAQIGKIQLEIKSLGIAIEQTGMEIQNTSGQIQELESQLNLHKAAMGCYLASLNELDSRSLTEILFKHQRLSEYFNQIKELEDTQNNLQLAIVEIKGIRSDLEDKKLTLENKENELQDLKRFQVSAKSSLEQNKTVKNKILVDTKGKEVKFQELVTKAQKDIEAIKGQIGYLLQQGITVEDAIKYGELAAMRLGIRPAFLIALLDVESGLGKNVGTGNWMDDMYNCYLKLGKESRAAQEKDAFFAIVNKLGIDPNSVKVSREPNYGCGGAMGPAQFIPTTWLAYEAQVANLTGHTLPNPWNIEDAFTAAAIKLAKGGAADKTRTGEIRAAKAYISGSSTCSSKICNYYSNIILNKAAIIESNL